MSKLYSDAVNLESSFKKIDRTAVPEVIMKQLKNYILNRKFLSGDKLPPERVLAEMLGVSRPPIREALKTLEALGIVEIRHGSGTYLREPNFNFTALPMTVFLSKEDEIIKELIEAREIIEVEIVTLAIKRITKSDIDRLEQFLQKRKQPGEVDRVRNEYDYEFEEKLGEIAKNRILLSIQKSTHNLWETSLRTIGFKPLPLSMINDEHQRIFEAIKNKDETTAREAIAYHLRAPLRFLEG